MMHLWAFGYILHSDAIEDVCVYIYLCTVYVNRCSSFVVSVYVYGYMDMYTYVYHCIWIYDNVYLDIGQLSIRIDMAM